MNKKYKHLSFYLGAIIFLAIWAVGAIWSSFYYPGKMEILKNDSGIDSIGMETITDSNSINSLGSVPYYTICDTQFLKKINSTLKQSEEFTPKTVHSTEVVDMYIYKKDAKRIDIRLCETLYDSWVLSIGNYSYKNDSLFKLLATWKGNTSK